MNLPNKLTLFRIILIPIFMGVLSTSFWDGTLLTAKINWAIAAFIFALASLTDFLDGKISRSRNLVTNFGKFFDPLADKLLVLTALTYFVHYSLLPAWAVSLFMIREVSVTALRALIIENNGEVLSAQWSGKIKTFTQMFAIIFLLMNNFGINFPIGQILIWVSLALTIYSGIEYFIKNRNVFSDGL